VYDQHPDVVATEMVTQRPGFRRDEEAVLAVDVAHIDRVTPLARQARQLSAYPVGDLACFNVDFSREFRYCLETGADPTPASELSTLRLSVPVTETSNDVYGELSVAGDTVTGSSTDILTAVQGALETHDPDVLVCSTSEIVPTLYEMATDADVDDFSLSRWPDVDYQQLREPVDVLELRPRRSLAGAVQRARPGDHRRVEHVLLRGDEPRRRPRPRVALEKPVQELAWASIGNVLTAIQICEANDRGVLVPWNSWRHEFYKADGDAPRRRPRRLHFRTRGRPPRERPRTRLLLVVSEYHLHSKRLTGRHPV